jgi:hypothetical protein
MRMRYNDLVLFAKLCALDRKSHLVTCEADRGKTSSKRPSNKSHVDPLYGSLSAQL